MTLHSFFKRQCVLGINAVLLGILWLTVKVHDSKQQFVNHTKWYLMSVLNPQQSKRDPCPDKPQFVCSHSKICVRVAFSLWITL